MGLFCDWESDCDGDCDCDCDCVGVGVDWDGVWDGVWDIVWDDACDGVCIFVCGEEVEDGEPRHDLSSESPTLRSFVQPKGTEREHHLPM